MEKLSIIHEGKVLALDLELTIEVNEEFPQGIRSGYFEVTADLPKPVIDNNLRLAL